MNNNRIFAVYHKELVENWYRKWTSDIRKKLPANFVVTDEEIDSEITYFCQYLASKFKFGSYIAYCSKFVTKLVVDSIWREYILLDHGALADAYADFEEDYEDEYSAQRQYGEYDADAYTAIEDEIENRDMTENIKNMAKDNIDKTIIQLILEGMAYDEIASKLKISTKTIQRRMKAIGDRIKEKENA